MVENIHWLGHDGFRIDGKATIYVDPWNLSAGAPKADLILITHDHYDHCSPDDVAEISKEGTVIVTIAAAARQLEGNVHVVKAGGRPVVAATTAGMGNPIVSTIEDIISFATSVLAIVAPYLVVAIILISLMLFTWWYVRRRQRRAH